MIETELKILNVDTEVITRKLVDFGASKVGEDLIIEKHFDFEDQRINLSDSLLRLRKVGNKIELTHKGSKVNDKEFQMHEETETVVNDFNAMEKILNILGLKCIKHREKKRISFKKNNLKFEIDQYPQIPAYLEIEGSKEDIREALAALGYSINQTVNINSTEVLKSYNVNCDLLKF